MSGQDQNFVPITEGESKQEQVTALIKNRGIDRTAEMDMTPMVDVTFLLLIFFMVTVSFSLQKSLEFPPAERKSEASQSRSIQDIENNDNYVIVKIDADNAYHVEDRETFSKQELLSILKDLKRADRPNGGTMTNMLIQADSQSKHETVVSCIDAGNAAGIEQIKLSTVDH